MSDFVGRTLELDRLTRLLTEISTRATAGRTHDVGTAVLLRGRRRVGKSRLVSELISVSRRVSRSSSSVRPTKSDTPHLQR